MPIADFAKFWFGGRVAWVVGGRHWEHVAERSESRAGREWTLYIEGIVVEGGVNGVMERSASGIGIGVAQRVI